MRHHPLVAGAVEGNGGVRSGGTGGEQVSRAAEVSAPLLSGRGDEQDGMARTQLHLLECLDDREHARDAPRVVADPRTHEAIAVTGDVVRDVGVEDRVEVRTDHHGRFVRRSSSLRDHIPGVIGGGVEAEFAQLRLHCGGPRTFQSRRSRNLGDRPLSLDGPVVTREQETSRRKQGVEDPPHGAEAVIHGPKRRVRDRAAQVRITRSGRYIAAVSRRALPPTVIALALVSLFTDISSEMIYPLVPAFLTTVLGVGALAVGAIEGAAESIAALLKFGSGWWSDRLTRRKPLVVAGYLIASCLRPLIGLATGAGQVLAIRMGDRVGKGIRSAPRDAMLADAVSPSERGRAFGFHRSADHLGAVIGPLVAFALLQWGAVSLRGVFLLAAIPAAIAMVVLVVMVRERMPGNEMMKEDRAGGAIFVTGGDPATVASPASPLGRRFYAYIGVLLLFTLGNSSDAFLLLRARDLGVRAPLIPILWAALHVVKSLSSMPAGALSDRVGRRGLIVAGWLVYAAVYLGFARAEGLGMAWLLFLIYGVYFGLTEGVEKALVADLVSPASRGRAFGWYNLALGVGALPASLVFGAIWDRWGAPTAFTLGASMAGLAAVSLVFVVPARLTVGE